LIGLIQFKYSIIQLVPFEVTGDSKTLIWWVDLQELGLVQSSSGSGLPGT